MKKPILTLLMIIGTGMLSICQAQSDPLSKSIKIKFHVHFNFHRQCYAGLGLCTELIINNKISGPITGITTFEGKDYLIIAREGLDDESISQFETARTFPIDDDITLTPGQLQSATYKGSIIILRGNYPIRLEENCILIPAKFEYQ